MLSFAVMRGATNWKWIAAFLLLISAHAVISRGDDQAATESSSSRTQANSKYTPVLIIDFTEFDCRKNPELIREFKDLSNQPSDEQNALRSAALLVTLEQKTPKHILVHHEQPRWEGSDLYVKTILGDREMTLAFSNSEWSQQGLQARMRLNLAKHQAPDAKKIIDQKSITASLSLLYDGTQLLSGQVVDAQFTSPEGKPVEMKTLVLGTAHLVAKPLAAKPTTDVAQEQ